MKNIITVFLILVLLFLLIGCKATNNDHIDHKKISKARTEAKSFMEFRDQMENIGFNIEIKNVDALNQKTNQNLEFIFAIFKIGDYKYIHFEFPDNGINETLNIESFITIDNTDCNIINTINPEGIDIIPEGVNWKIINKDGQNNYWLGFYAKSKNSQEEFHGELTFSHGDYHWRGYF